MRLQVLSILNAEMNIQFKTFFYWQIIQTKCFNCHFKWSNHCLSLYRLYTWKLNDKDIKWNLNSLHDWRLIYGSDSEIISLALINLIQFTQDRTWKEEVKKKKEEEEEGKEEDGMNKREGRRTQLQKMPSNNSWRGDCIGIDVKS